MKSIIYFLHKVHRYSGKAVYFNLFAMTGIGLLEGVAILLLVPMISMSGVVDMGVEEIPFLQYFSFIENIPPHVGLPAILGIYLLIVIGQHAINRKLIIRNTEIRQGFLQHLRKETYASLLHADWAFYIRRRKTDIINVLTSEIARTSAGAHSVLQFISSLIFSFIQIGIAFMLSPAITLLVLFCGSILIFFNRTFLKRSMALGKRNYELGKEYMGGITDQMNGIKEIKSNGLEPSRLQWFESITDGMKAEQINYSRLKATSQFYYKIASALLIALFIYAAILMFHAQAAQLMLIIVVFARLWPTVAGIQSSLEQIATTLPSFKAVIDLQEECCEARELELQGAASNAMGLMEVKSDISCQQVYFRYGSLTSYALENVSVTIPVNQMTAVVGKSGAGKSTLIDMLMGLNVPEKGEILIDRMPLDRMQLPALRRMISYVPQDPFLFHTSIRENLTLVKPDADDAQIWEALDFSSAAEFVRNLPDGLDTVIGDRGIKLSGGERQRLVLARAILRKPSILVLDEATSALDSENETRIQEALERLKGRMTIIVIAHRLSTIRNADQVIVLERGRVIQRGNFLQLSDEKESVFSDLLEKQMQAIQ